jgi:hypothetical protein
LSHSPPHWVAMASGGARLFLSEHTGDARPDTLVYLRMPGLDAIAKKFSTDVEQMPWGPELWLRDPDGTRVRIGEPTG